MPDWNDMQNAIRDDTFDSMDRATLEAYMKVKPPQLTPQWTLIWQQAHAQMARALQRFDDNDRENKESARHREALERAEGANHIAKWAIVIAGVALIVSIIQTFWD